MAFVKAFVDHHIWVDRNYLPAGVEQFITEALTFDNQEYLKALKLHLADADHMDPYVEMYEYEGDWLVMPRGFASQLGEGAEALGIDLRWHDERCRTDGFVGGEEIPARPYQEKIIRAIIEAEQGIAKAPSGSGKTVAALEIIRRKHGNAIVIVNTKEIMQQWIDRAAQWLGEDYPVGMIGDGEFEISEGLTVAIQATLWSRHEQLKRDNFFRRFRTVCLDECHHATAETYQYVVNQFQAEVRFGQSATPEKTGDFNIAQAVLGPIVVEVTEEDVEKSIIRPEVHVWQTEFGALYKGDKKTDRGYRRNNYHEIVQFLTEDQKRTQLIVDVLLAEHPGNANLMISKRLDHLSNLWECLVASGYSQEQIMTIVGMDSRAERKEVVALTEKANCVVLSTLADEALDAPRLDRLFLTFPTANPKLVEQQVGRIRRRHPEKADAIVIDFRDIQVGPLNKQYMTRRHECYDRLGFEVVKRKDNLK